MVTDAFRALLRRFRRVSHPLKQEKLRLIDFALSRGAARFADLGGMWGVDGGYAATRPITAPPPSCW